MRLFLVLLFLVVGCGESPEIYSTTCPVRDDVEHFGFISIDGVDKSGYGYWACMGNDCSSVYTFKYGVRVEPMGDDTLKVCCGGGLSRVDKVNVVVLK